VLFKNFDGEYLWLADIPYKKSRIPDLAIATKINRHRGDLPRP